MNSGIVDLLPFTELEDMAGRSKRLIVGTLSRMVSVYIMGKVVGQGGYTTSFVIIFLVSTAPSVGAQNV